MFSRFVFCSQLQELLRVVPEAHQHVREHLGVEGDPDVRLTRQFLQVPREVESDLPHNL